MKKIFLYEGRGKNQKQTNKFVMVDDEDYDMLNAHKWFLMSIYHTENKIYYARRYEKNTGQKVKAILMHRVILGLAGKEEKGDHVDGNGLNNQRANLRKSTHSQNMSNRKSASNSTSSYLGVHKYINRKGAERYQVSIKHNDKTYSKAGFISEDVAAGYYNSKASELKKEFARLNIIRWY